MISATLATAALVAAQAILATTDRVTAQNGTIVLMGQRTSDLKAALAACLARGCPTDQDVDATLALAEKQFIDGHYEDARKVIAASIERTHRATKAYPVPV